MGFRMNWNIPSLSPASHRNAKSVTRVASVYIPVRAGTDDERTKWIGFFEAFKNKRVLPKQNL